MLATCYVACPVVRGGMGESRKGAVRKTVQVPKLTPALSGCIRLDPTTFDSLRLKPGL